MNIDEISHQCAIGNIKPELAHDWMEEKGRLIQLESDNRYLRNMMDEYKLQLKYYKNELDKK